jgi:hypothetical protein
LLALKGGIFHPKFFTYQSEAPIIMDKAASHALPIYMHTHTNTYSVQIILWEGVFWDMIPRNLVDKNPDNGAMGSSKIWEYNHQTTQHHLRDFSLHHTHPESNWYKGPLTGVKLPGFCVDHPHHLVPRLRILPSLSQSWQLWDDYFYFGQGTIIL